MASPTIGCQLFVFLALAALTFVEEIKTADVTQPAIKVVKTKSGPIAGLAINTENGQKLNVFYGIPYAQPPVGNLRFKPPKQIGKWNSELQALKPRPMCYQQLGTVDDSEKSNMLRFMLRRPWSEDCLHLNIWAPNLTEEKVPVMVFIHGGGFVFGSGTWLADGTFLATEGVLVVSINYRLGAFGFLNVGQSDAPGNVGLMDQNLALHWVKENIESFGGDPDKITIIGMSAGGASVGYHLLSPKSRGLFARAIMMSGSPTNWWSILEPEQSVALSNKLLEYIGCKSPNLTTSMECARYIHPEDILDGARRKTQDLRSNLVPTVDGEFITEHPAVSVASGRFNPGNVIIGTTADEGAEFVRGFNPSLFKTKDGRLFKRDFEAVVRKSHPSLSDLQVEALSILYTADSVSPDDPLQLRDDAKDIYTDSMFECHIREFADRLAETESTVYRYLFDYGFSFVGQFFARWAKKPHGIDQMAIMLPPPMAKQFLVNPTDIEAARKLRTHFINFAKSGDPNLEKEQLKEEPEWPKYNTGKEYLYFSSPASTVGTSPRPAQCAVWLNLLPILAQKNTC